MMNSYQPHEYRQLALKTDYRQFRDDEFWTEIPIWKNVSKGEFGDNLWQIKSAIHKVHMVKQALGDRVSDEFMHDLEEAQKLSPMNIRITPYVFSLINWDDPYNDPLRKQFLPLASQFLPDHPFGMEDSLAEDVDSPVPQLTHRYPDKVLFLPLAICPVYCSYCTRSRLIGGSTETVHKDTYGASTKNWDNVFNYIKTTETVEDVVISGGDVSMLTAKHIRYIGESLLNIPHIRRIRYATKAVSIYPMKFTHDDEWMQALGEVHKKARNMGKQVFLHTHFSSPNEMTEWSVRAAERLFDMGIIVRNQAVLQNGVNNDPAIMIKLVKQVGYLNIQPYYTFVHDMVQGCEHLRTTLRDAIELEKIVRGITGGYNIPNFVCDLPGGGGKRHAASYEHYDEVNGISVWKAPSVKGDRLFTYFDPIHLLGEEAQKRWADESERKKMVEVAKSHVR